MPRPSYPQWECTTQVKKNGKMVGVHLTLPTEDGTLVGGCYKMYRNKKVDIARFAPYGDSHNTNSKHQRFHAALAAFYAAREGGDEAEAEAREQRKIVEALRTQRCDMCREVSRKKISPAHQACRDEWGCMRQDKCHEQDGCANKACAERGMASWTVLQADHGTNHKKHDLSNYQWWAGRGGVPAMREEAKQIHQWVCGTCHAIESTSASGQEHDPEKMPDGKRRGTRIEIKQYNTKIRAKITFPKNEHVNKHKHWIGKCQYKGCTTECVAGNEVGFHWDHRVESTKRKCRCLNAKSEPKDAYRGCADQFFRRDGGVSGLAGNATRATALEHTKGFLNAEMVKCDLLCVSCHRSCKPRKRGRWDESLSAAPEAEVAVEAVAVAEQLETESESDSEA